MTDRDRSAQVAAEIRAEIMSGDLPPGTTAPSVPALQRRFAISNQTAQNAMRILKDEGYVEARRGSGTFIRSSPHETIEPAEYGRTPTPGAPHPWTAHPPRTIRLIGVGEVPAPAKVAAAFGVASGEPVVCREQVWLAGDDPVEYDRIYFPTGIARGTPLAAGRKIRGGAAAVLAELGLAPREFDDLISTRPATPREAELLALPRVVPVLHTFRVVLAGGGRAVSAEEIVKAGNRWQVRYRWPAAG
ncbi:GntR family transcriptional regulator [Catenuloplanes japonicus]|uniref:GntR family transcriptional regulator n=1 Tax=Catenuloplanes japonicus TaxID=33876 RepID=UPI000526D046|nr:GntR family transcriptional regulator [Catenuloplanes japonicus]